MATMSPLRRRMIDDMMVRSLSPGDATILHLCGCKVPQTFRPFSGSAWSGGRARLLEHVSAGLNRGIPWDV
jgi:hypothetical protein